MAIDPHAARDRYRQAVRERGVSCYLHEGSATAMITADGLPPDEAAAACARLDRLAAKVERAGHPGRLRQIAADLFLGMLDGRWSGWTEPQIIADLLARRRPEDQPLPEPRNQPPTSRRPPASRCRAAPAGADPPTRAFPPDARDRRPAWPQNASATEPAAPEPSPASRPPAGVLMPRIAAGAGGGAGRDRDPGRAGHPAGPRPPAGEIPGLGPVTAEAARAAVAAQRRGAEWRWAVVDEAGYLLLAGVTRRRPHTSRRADPPRRRRSRSGAGSSSCTCRWRC